MSDISSKTPSYDVSALNICKSYTFPSEALDKGIWVHVTEDYQFRLRPSFTSNKEHQAALIKANKNKLFSKETEKAKLALIKIYTKTIITDWKGVKDTSGKEIPYSRELAYEVLRTCPDLWNELVADAHDRENFTKGVIDTTGE